MVLAVSVLALAGCVDTGMIGFKTALPGDGAKTVAGQKPPTVNPDQINDDNAHAMARALEKEIEFDGRQDEPKPPPPHK